jgi:acyl-CoA synthetase (AMP-forming)/AMP-acid ligase II
VPLATIPTDIPLPAVFARGATAATGGAGITIVGPGTQDHKSYAELQEIGARRATGLAARGVGPGDPVCLFAHTSFDFVTCLLGLWNLGAIAVPLPFPPRVVTKDAWLEGSRSRISRAKAKLLLLADGDPDLQDVPTQRISVIEEAQMGDIDGPVPTDVALYQFSSGSTGHPTGVVLTHRAIAAQLDMNTRIHVVEGVERTFAWLPMYHDLGLFTFLLTPMSNGLDCVLMPTAQFLKDPLRWMVEMSSRRANISSAPSFGFGLAARALERTDADLDLSDWTQAYCGGEPIDPRTMDRFIRAAGNHGFSERNLLPGYGLAEAACVVTARRSGEGVRVDRVDRERFVAGEAGSATAETERSATFVSVGTPLPTVELAISNTDGEILPDRSVGEISVKSSSMMDGYLNDPEATARAFRDGWLRTGDLGYLADGELFITGRMKDVIIISGQNHHAEDIERVVSKVPGLRPGGCICVQTVETENSLVVLAETADGASAQQLADIRGEIARLIAFEVGLTAGDIVLLPARSLPKTSSGKLQRRLAKGMYEDGRLTSLLTG